MEAVTNEKLKKVTQQWKHRREGGEAGGRYHNLAPYLYFSAVVHVGKQQNELYISLLCCILPRWIMDYHVFQSNNFRVQTHANAKRTKLLKSWCIIPFLYALVVFFKLHF